MTIATAQLLVGVIYAVFLWIAPDARKTPNITVSDFFKMIPAGVCSAGAHAASVFALAAGGVAFGQIVKAAEPAFAAVIGTFVYNKKISAAKWCCLIPIIGGVCLAALKQNKDGSIEMDFTMGGLIGALVANVFAAFKGTCVLTKTTLTSFIFVKDFTIFHPNRISYDANTVCNCQCNPCTFNAIL